MNSMTCTAPVLDWQAALKKDESKMRIINWRCYVISGRKMNHRWSMSCYLSIIKKLITNTCKIMIKIKNHHILSIENK